MTEYSRCVIAHIIIVLITGLLIIFTTDSFASQLSSLHTTYDSHSALTCSKRTLSVCPGCCPGQRAIYWAALESVVEAEAAGSTYCSLPLSKAGL